MDNILSRSKKIGLPLISSHLSVDPSTLAVQNKLQSVSNGQSPPAFLKDCATIAIDILKITQDVKDEDIAKDTEFMNLALDGCGLVYIIVHRCIEHMDRQTTVARDMERDAPDLALQLEHVRAFFEKKANGSLYRRVNPLKRNKDAHKIATFRNQLREWIARFGGLARHESIHELLQELFANRDKEIEDEQMVDARNTQEALVSIKAVGSLASNLESLHIRNDGPHLQVSDPYSSAWPPSMSMPTPVTFDHFQHPSMSMVHPPKFPFAMPNSAEADLRAAQAVRLKRCEDERRDEREQLRQAEQEYNKLPYLTPIVHTEQNHCLSYGSDLPSIAFARVDEDDSAAAAHALHEEYQRQFELKDRQMAIVEAGKLQLETEEQEQFEALESKRQKNHDRKRSSHHRPVGNGRPPSATLDRPQNYGPTSFDNLEGSGVSIGGGPVHVHNGGGNTTTITYRDSHNDNSVRYYYGSR